MFGRSLGRQSSDWMWSKAALVPEPLAKSTVVVSFRTTIASKIAMNKYSNKKSSNKATHRHIPKQKAELCFRRT